MKMPSIPLLPSLIVVLVGLTSTASAGTPSPRQIEENPALVRPATPAKGTRCSLCAISTNSAYQRSPRDIEEKPELARAVKCATEMPVKAPGIVVAQTSAWPRILETR